MRSPRTFVVSWLLLACAQTTAPTGPTAGSEPPPVQGGGSAAAPDAAQAFDNRPEPVPEPAGGAASAPPGTPQPCPGHPLPGDACDPAQNVQCHLEHCRVSRLLECKGGVWSLMPDTSQFASLPLDFVCAPGSEPISSFCELEAQCCGQTLEQPTGCAMGGCDSCPVTQPEDGTSCTLPAACDDQPGLRVIDCYYPCCCYGGATWAQCNGERWHLTSNCSSK